MNKVTFLIVVVLTLFMSGCEPGLVYEKAVPPGLDNLTEIPELYQGSFLCNTDSTRVYVTDKAIIEEYYHQFVTSIDKIDESENCVIVGRGIHFKDQQVCVPFEYISDRLVTGKIYKVDTLFSISPKQVLRTYKGHLFFNYQMPQGNWVATMLTPTDDAGFKLRLLDMNEDVTKIEATSAQVKTKELKDDKIQYIINPTLVEFDNIMEAPNRTACEKFIRISTRYNQSP